MQDDADKQGKGEGVGKGVVNEREISTGRLSRFMKLSALTAGASTRYLGNKVKGMFQDAQARQESMLKGHLETARKTVEVMGDLKGAVMKVGQMISLHPEKGVLPREMTELFNKLQNQAPTLPFSAIRVQIEKELGQPLEALFARFEEEPMAAASLGQVHAATLPSGEEVVVKIQYPGIDRTVESDLWQLRTLMRSSGLLNRTDEADLVFKEVEARLKEELDYTLEAFNIVAFRQFFQDEPRISIPRYFPDFSTQRVLTMERLDGYTLDEILERHPEQSWRDELGAQLFDLMLTQMVQLRRLHADPQLGNYRFLDDRRVVMYDLGCVKRFDEHFVNSYIGLAEAGVADDRPVFERYLADLGILEGGNEEAYQLARRFSEIVLEPFLVPRYRFGVDSDMVALLKPLAPMFLAHPEIKPHPDLIYLHRAYIGLFFILTRLKAQADWWSIFRKHAEWMKTTALLEEVPE